jgi:MFS family permease
LSAAGRIDPPGPSLAAAFTLGYTGFIVGPPVIGVLSDRTGLPHTLALLVLALVAVTALGGRAMTTSKAEASAEAQFAVEEIAS